MDKLFCPDMCFNSIFDIGPDFLKDKNIHNIIVDIDNTLSCWGSKEPEPNVCDWIDKTRKKGFKICILSNSSNKRIKRYCSNIDVLYVKNVRKPFKSSFMKAMKLMDSNSYNTCVIGDQIFTDIIGGNNCGLYTILVLPIDKKEFVFTRLMRKLEKRLLNKYT